MFVLRGGLSDIVFQRSPYSHNTEVFVTFVHGQSTSLGGEGEDAYLFGWMSSGNDVVVELPVGASTVALTEDAVLADLGHERVENDLILTIHSGGGGTLTLKDYFVSSHAWMISEQNGTTIDVVDWSFQSLLSILRRCKRIFWMLHVRNGQMIY